MAGSDPGEWAYRWSLDDERWSKGRGLCTAPGGLEGRGKWGSVGWLCPPYPPPKPPPLPRRQALPLWKPRTQPPSNPLLLTLLPSHFLHPTPHAHLGGVPCSPEEGAVETPPQGSPHRPLCSCSLFRPPWPGPRPGAQTWALRLAAVLSKVVFRPSDLQVLFYVPWASWGLHPLGGTLGSPAPPGHAAWVPVPGTSTTRISSWCWETQQSCPGGAHPVALPPFELSSLLACRTSRSPPLAGGAPTFTCLELAQLGARKGKDTPSSPHPCFAARTGQDCRAGVGSASWDGISSGNRESKPISRDVPLTRPGLGWKIRLLWPSQP